MATTRTVTVENTTEHPFDFCHWEHGALGVRVPPARVETPAGSQVAARKNGSAEVPELLLARCVREPVVRFWFSSRDLVLPTTTVEKLLAIEIPVDPQATKAQVSEAVAAENVALKARIAELEKPKAKENAPAK